MRPSASRVKASRSKKTVASVKGSAGILAAAAWISAGDADSAANGIQQAGVTARVKLGTFDMNETNLDRIKDGTQLFAIDQQPWLQGFLAVSLADGFYNYGLKTATPTILTGPGIVDASNIDATMAGAKAGYR